jgi:class 3 adenylate cyclase
VRSVSENLAASEEIEQTLRLEGDQIERQIATFRVWFFVSVVVGSVAMNLVSRQRGLANSWLPALFYCGWLAYAALLRRIVARVGARDGIIYLSLLLDLVAMAWPGIVLPRIGAGFESRELMQMFAAHLTGAGQLVVLAINLLRMHARAALVGAIASVAIVLIVLLPIEGFVPPIGPTILTLLLTAVLGRAAASRARHSLESFARMGLLRRYLPPAAVERVMRERPDAALALGGRLAKVTLLAADLRGFTRMSEKLPPEEVVRQLNDCHGRMLEQIERAGGALDKFMGDGILAIFGFVTDGRPAADAGAGAAVGCARAMLGALAELNEERARAGLPPLVMGIGVHTGEVVAGNIGAPGRRLEFTVIGDAVNTAARLEGLTKEAGCELLVSGAAVEHAGAEGLAELPPMQVRGRQEPLRVFAPRVLQV